MIRKTSIQLLHCFVKQYNSKFNLFKKKITCGPLLPQSEMGENTGGGNQSLELAIPSIVMAGCKLLVVYNQELYAVKYINSAILLKGGAKQSTLARGLNV